MSTDRRSGQPPVTPDDIKRIESKIDSMAEAIVALARVEVKISDLEERRMEQQHTLEHTVGQVIDLKREVAKLVQTIATQQKVFFVLLTSVAAAAASQYFT